jgi:hypothetical protein
MPTPRLDAHGRPTAFARDLQEALVVVAGSTTMVAAAMVALAMVAPGTQAAVPGELAMAQAHAILDHVHTWRGSHGTTPSDLSEVYGNAVPVDPWGNPWQLEQESGGLTVVSHGADGAPGGEGASADIRLADLESLLRRPDDWFGAT